MSLLVCLSYEYENRRAHLNHFRSLNQTPPKPQQSNVKLKASSFPDTISSILGVGVGAGAAAAAAAAVAVAADDEKRISNRDERVESKFNLICCWRRCPLHGIARWRKR